MTAGTDFTTLRGGNRLDSSSGVSTCAATVPLPQVASVRSVVRRTGWPPSHVSVPRHYSAGTFYSEKKLRSSNTTSAPAAPAQPIEIDFNGRPLLTISTNAGSMDCV